MSIRDLIAAIVIAAVVIVEFTFFVVRPQAESLADKMLRYEQPAHTKEPSKIERPRAPPTEAERRAIINDLFGTSY